MKTLKRIIRETLTDFNIIPVKEVDLGTGLKCLHYKNGKIEVETN